MTSIGFPGLSNAKKPRGPEHYSFVITGTTQSSLVTTANGDERLILVAHFCSNYAGVHHQYSLFFGSGNQSVSAKAIRFSLAAESGIEASNMTEMEKYGGFGETLYAMRLTAGAGVSFLCNVWVMRESRRNE